MGYTKDRNHGSMRVALLLLEIMHITTTITIATNTTVESCQDTAGLGGGRAPDLRLAEITTFNFIKIQHNSSKYYVSIQCALGEVINVLGATYGKDKCGSGNSATDVRVTVEGRQGLIYQLALTKKHGLTEFP